MRARRPDTPAPQTGFRGDVDALAERVDELAAIVRQASGSVVAVQGELARSERSRVESAMHLDAALGKVQDELAALRERPAPSPTAPAGGSHAEEIAVLADRVRTLSEMVSQNAGQLAAREGGLSLLRSALTEEGIRVDEALAEMRREITALAGRVAAAAAVRPPLATPDERLAGRVTAIGDRVDVLADTMRETAGGLVAASGELSRIEARVGVRVAGLETALDASSTETRRAIAALERELAQLRENAATDPASQEQSRRLANAVQALGDRIDTISGIVHSSSGRLTGGDEIGTDLEQRLAALVTHVDALTIEVRRERETVAEVDTKIAPLAAALERLAGRVDELSLETTQVDMALHDALASRVDELELGHTALRADLDASVSEHEALRTEITATVFDLATGQEILRSDLTAKVTELTTSHELLASEIESVSAVAHEALERELPDPGPVLHELAAKLERIDADRRVVADQLAEAEAAWRDEREALRTRLAAITLSADGGPPGEDAERLVQELTVRLDRLERDRESVADIASLAEGWRNSLGVLAARVEYGLIKLTQANEPPAGPAEARELVDLAARVASMEADRDSVMGELTRATESWADERAALHERVAELAARIVTGPLDVGTATGVAAAQLGDAGPELDRLRIGLEGMRMRLAYHEKAVAELGGGKLASRLEELSQRLDRLQQSIAFGSGSFTADGADALLGVDVDGLMRRVEHAERAALDQRKDMLGHLEKIAAQMDWRLQRLERTEARVIA